MSTLMALCEKADNDVRSCLNTLQVQNCFVVFHYQICVLLPTQFCQFLGQKQKHITLALVQGASIGQKDAQRSLFSLWKEIFQLPITKKYIVVTKSVWPHTQALQCRGGERACIPP